MVAITTISECDSMATTDNKQRLEKVHHVSERGLATASEISRELNIPTKVLCELFTPAEWHHAQAHYSHRSDGMPTDYYNTQEISDVVNKNYNSEYYNKDEIDKKYEQLQEAIRKYKEEQQHSHDIVEKHNGFFGYCNDDGSGACWFQGTAIYRKNGWWYLPDGSRKRKIYTLEEKDFKRKRNKKIYAYS